MRTQASLHQRPNVIRSCRGNSALMLLFATGFVAIGACMLRHPKPGTTIGYLLVIFFGLAFPFLEGGWSVLTC